MGMKVGDNPEEQARLAKLNERLADSSRVVAAAPDARLCHIHVWYGPGNAQFVGNAFSPGMCRSRWLSRQYP